MRGGPKSYMVDFRVSSILTSDLFKRVEPNATWKLRWLLTPMVSGSNPATRTNKFL